MMDETGVWLQGRLDLLVGCHGQLCQWFCNHVRGTDYSGERCMKLGLVLLGLHSFYITHVSFFSTF